MGSAGPLHLITITMIEILHLIITIINHHHYDDDHHQHHNHDDDGDQHQHADLSGPVDLWLWVSSSYTSQLCPATLLHLLAK